MVSGSLVFTEQASKVPREILESIQIRHRFSFDTDSASTKIVPGWLVYTDGNR